MQYMKTFIFKFYKEIISSIFFLSFVLRHRCNVIWNFNINYVQRGVLWTCTLVHDQMRLTLHLVTPPPLNDEMIELNSACLSWWDIHWNLCNRKKICSYFLSKLFFYKSDIVDSWYSVHTHHYYISTCIVVHTAGLGNKWLF